VEAEWRPSENNRRARYYTLTPSGRRRLKEETAAWRRYFPRRRSRPRGEIAAACASRITSAAPFWYLGRRRRTVEAEIDEELALHLEMRARELIERGVPPEEARREARRQFGDLEGTRRYCRQEDERKERRMQRWLVLDDVVQDLRMVLGGGCGARR